MFEYVSTYTMCSFTHDIFNYLHCYTWIRIVLEAVVQLRNLLVKLRVLAHPIRNSARETRCKRSKRAEHRNTIARRARTATLPRHTAVRCRVYVSGQSTGGWSRFDQYDCSLYQSIALAYA